MVNAVVINSEVIMLKVDFNEKLKLSKENYLPASETYKIDSIEHKNNKTYLNVSVGTYKATLTCEKILSKNYANSEVSIEFDSTGEIVNIR